MSIDIKEFEQWAEKARKSKSSHIETAIFDEFVKIAVLELNVGYESARDAIDKIVDGHFNDCSKLASMIRHNAKQVKDKLWSLRRFAVSKQGEKAMIEIGLLR